MLSRIENIRLAQDRFFKSNKTQDIKFRIEQLKALKLSIKKYETELFNALNIDLGKNEFEAFTNEIGLAQKEITYHIKNLKKWAKPIRVKTPVYAFPSSSYIYQQPYGRVLIIGPFNFPFMLTVIPLVGAISAGNVVVIKPSENTQKTSEVIGKIINEVFSENYVAFIQGGVETSQLLLNQKWDKIFFTGSIQVGKIVMEAAAKNLTPVELELGGKNPAVVDYDANLKIAAKRITWGKFLNAGQTCVAPDYIISHPDVKDSLVANIRKCINHYSIN